MKVCIYNDARVFFEKKRWLFSLKQVKGIAFKAQSELSCQFANVQSIYSKYFYTGCNKQSN